MFQITNPPFATLNELTMNVYCKFEFQKDKTVNQMSDDKSKLCSNGKNMSGH